MDNNYVDARYDIFDGGLKEDKELTNIILYVDKIGIDINLANIKNAVKVMNNLLLQKDIHLDYNVVRNYISPKAGSQNIFGVGEKPIMLLANDDVTGTVDGLVSTYSINLRTTFNRNELVDRLNSVFKPNNTINSADFDPNNKSDLPYRGGADGAGG